MERLVDLIRRYWLAALKPVYEILELRPLIHPPRQSRPLRRFRHLLSHLLLFYLEPVSRDRPFNS